MPIEIKELHIKINVDEKATKTTTKTSSLDEGKIMRAISESVEQVVNINKRKKER